MAYTRVNWEDLPSTNTPRNATNLNKMDAGIKENDDKLNGNKAMGSIVVEDVKCKNMFNKNVVNKDTNINTEGGTFYQANVCLSPYIEVNDSTTYIISKQSSSQFYWTIVYYDSSKTYLSGNSYTINANSSRTITTPENCKYVRFNIQTASLDTGMMELGSTASTYTPYKDFENSVVLYETPSTINAQSTITFDDISNYNYVEILYGQVNRAYSNSMKIVPSIAIGNAVSFTINGPHANEGIIYYNSARYILTSTSLTFGRVTQKEFKSDNTIATTTSTTPTNIAIYKIIGYK